MERWNKQIIACLLIAVILSFVAFSNQLSYNTDAMTRSSFEASANGSRKTGIITDFNESEKIFYTGDRALAFLNSTDSSDGKEITEDKKSLVEIADIKSADLQKKVNVVQEIKKNVFFEDGVESVWKDPKEIQASITAAEVPVVAAAEVPSEWDNKAIAKVEEAANIREQADTGSALVGFLKKGAAAEILEQNGEWTKISSGSVTGYVSNEFLAFGTEAEELANQQGRRVATVQADTLRVRKEPGEEAAIAALAAQGNTLTVNSDENGWLNVTLDSGETGYVKCDYVSVELKLGTAISLEEEQAAIRAAEQTAAEKAAAEQEAKKKNVTKTTNRNTTEAEVDEATLLAGLVQLEAGGECYEGKLAVANVVINRVNSSRYPKSIRSVIYQSGQFPGATNGKLDKILAKAVRSDCLKAAREAIDGKNNIGNYMHFNSVGTLNINSLGDYTIIGNQCFY